MIMLGFPKAKCRFAFVPLFEGSLSGEKRLADDDALGLPVRKIQPVVFPANIRKPIRDSQHIAMKSEDFRAYFQSDTPVFIRNYARNWPACNKWRGANYSGYAHGHRHVPVEITTPDEATCTSRPEEGLMSLPDVVEHMLAPGEKMVYIAQHPLVTYLPDLCDDVKQPELIEVANKHTADICNVWMGTAATGPALHFDSPDNLLVQLVGDKQVLLLPPSDKQYLQLPHSQSNISPINLENVTYDTDLTPLHGHSTVLHPGDMLYISAQHWHYLESLNSSISVNFWF